MTREQLVELLLERQEGGVKLEFSGKSNARKMARKVRPRVQRSLKSLSVGDAEAQSRNLIVEGDNLQAMVTMYRERGQVDLILADPPYNTGQDFRYNDKWDEDPNDPGLGELVTDDEAAKHTKWMKFMLPRLKMMHSMLKPSGVLAICIDHRELFHLGQMLDELFDDKNRLAIINWQKSYAPKSHDGHISTGTEYVLVYAKDKTKATTGLLERAAATDAKYGNPDGDWGLWRTDNATAMGASTHPGQLYGIQNPFTGEVQYPTAGRCWAAQRSKMKRWLQQWGSAYEDRDLGDGMPSKALMVAGAKYPTTDTDPVIKASRAAAEKIRDNEVWPELWWGKQGVGRPNRKRYLERVKQGIVPLTYWADDNYDDPEELGSVSWDHEESGHSQTGIKELTAIVGAGHGFETVKPMKLFSKIIQLWCPPNGLVLDPFAGSGTTGHAVLALNETSGTKRRFLLIEQGRPEKGDSYARSLTADRMNRVVTGKWANDRGTPLAGGFRFVCLEKKVDADALLAMEREEMVDTVIASYFDTTRRRGSGLISVDPDEYRYLVARNDDNEGFFLIWEGPNKNTDFDEDVYELCSEEATQAGLKPNYHVYARYNLFQTENVRFYQIPDRILVDFGLDLRSDSFDDDTDEASSD
jgi:adenine-specific DNA-methyltransferase